MNQNKSTDSIQYIAKTLYRSGQIAIGSQLVAIIGLGLSFFLLAQDGQLYVIESSEDLYTVYEADLEFIQSNNFYAYNFIMAVVSLVPVVGMLHVIWAWHHYLQDSGVGVGNWVASSFGIMGATLIFLGFGLIVWGMRLSIRGLGDRENAAELTYLMYVLVLTMQVVSILCLYVLYPLGLVIAAWGKNLLPQWLTWTILVLSGIGLIIFVVGVNAVWVIQPAQLIIVLIPFVMGTALMRRAQTLVAIQRLAL